MNRELIDLKKNEKPLDRINPTCGFASIFKTIGVIGDSLSSGEFESHDEDGNILYNDMYEYSWPSCLERLTGTKYKNFSRGGMTAREYIQTWANDNNFFIPCQAYIINLGFNDIFYFKHPVGDITDIDLKDYSKNKNTYFGNIGKIIFKYRNLVTDCRIFIVTMTLDDESEEKNNLIREIAKKINEFCQKEKYIYCIDLATYGPVYDKKTRESFSMGYHPNAMGYYVYALAIGNYIDYIIKSNMKDFFTIPFSGTNKKNKFYS